MNRVGSGLNLIKKKRIDGESFISFQPSKEIWMRRIKLQTSLHRFYKKTHMKGYIQACI